MCIQVFGGGDMWKRDHLEDLDVDGKITLKWIIKTVERGMDWIVMRRAFANAVMTLRVS